MILLRSPHVSKTAQEKAMESPTPSIETQLRAFRDDAEMIATAVVEAVCQDLQKEVKSYTEDDEFYFDFAGGMTVGTAASLFLAFTDAMEKHLSQRLESIIQGGNPDVDWASFVKGMDLQAQFREILGQALGRARPGVGRHLGRALSSLFRDDLEVLTEEAQADALRVRQELLGTCPTLKRLVKEEVHSLVSKAYLDGLARVNPLGAA